MLRFMKIGLHQVYCSGRRNGVGTPELQEPLISSLQGPHPEPLRPLAFSTMQYGFPK